MNDAWTDRIDDGVMGDEWPSVIDVGGGSSNIDFGVWDDEYEPV